MGGSLERWQHNYGLSCYVYKYCSTMATTIAWAFFTEVTAAKCLILNLLTYYILYYSVVMA